MQKKNRQTINNDHNDDYEEDDDDEDSENYEKNPTNLKNNIGVKKTMKLNHNYENGQVKYVYHFYDVLPGLL